MSRMLLTGNRAAAWGARLAKTDYYPAFPITPQTEIIEALAKRSRRTLERLEYKNVQVKHGDGFQGWPDEAPFDAIIVTCAPEEVPGPLLEQLKVGGRLVIPLGPQWRWQWLKVITRTGKEIGRAHV